MYWPSIAHVLHMPLRDIDRLTGDDFDIAVSYVVKLGKAGGHGQ